MAATPPTEHGAPDAGSTALGPERIGRWLGRQRELREISIQELSERTRIPIRSLERLESGAFDGQRDGFVRGFVRTVALDLGLDPEDAVARMLAEPELEASVVRHSAISLQAVGAVATLALLFALSALGVRWLFGVVGGRAVPAHAVVRHDPVRALAAAHRDVEGVAPVRAPTALDETGRRVPFAAASGVGAPAADGGETDGGG